MLVGTLKDPITNCTKGKINAIAKTVTRVKSCNRAGEKDKNSAWITFHSAFPFTLNRPITKRRKTKINTIAKTVTRVKSYNRGGKKRKNTKIALRLHFITHFLSR